MSRGTGLCSAAVVFSKLEASGRVHYRAEWSTYRANKRADGAFQKVTRTVSRQQASGEWEVLVSDHRNKVYDPVFTQVLEGFEVDDFNRSMLLAQGQFDAFMNAKEGERAKILERLTSTTEYQAIGMKAGVVAKGHRDHINDLKVLADADASLTTEEATALEAEYTEREARQQQAKTAHADALAQQQWMLDAERRISAWTAAKTALQTAEAEGKAFEADSLRVKAHERAEAAGAFTALQESLRLDREVEESRTIIEQIDAQLPGLEAKKNDAAESLQKATAVRDGADGFLRELRPLTNSAHERSQYLGQVRAEAAKAKAELEAATTKYQRQAASIESKQAAMEGLRAALTQTRTAFVEALNSLTEAHGAVWTEAVHAQSAALSEEGFDSASP